MITPFIAGFISCGAIAALVAAYKSDGRAEADALREDQSYRRGYERGWRDYGKTLSIHTPKKP